jgi:hypothetical protein
LANYLSGSLVTTIFQFTTGNNLVWLQVPHIPLLSFSPFALSVLSPMSFSTSPTSFSCCQYLSKI